MNTDANMRRDTVHRRNDTGDRQHVTLTKILIFVVLAALIVGGILWWRSRDRTDTSARSDMIDTRPGASRVIDTPPPTSPTPPATRPMEAPAAPR